MPTFPVSLSPMPAFKRIAPPSLLFALPFSLVGACGSDETLHAGKADANEESDGSSSGSGASLVPGSGGSLNSDSGGSTALGVGGTKTSGAGGATKPSTGGGSGTPTDGGDVFGDLHSGEATYYSATGEGACSFDASPGDLMVAALNNPEWNNSGWCGACAQVSGPSGEMLVRIVDLCPECSPGDLDLSPTAFDKIAERALGRVDISWAFVSCPTRGNVSYRFKDGAHQYWTAIQVLNHRVPVESMEWSKDTNSWTKMPRENYGYFLEASGFGEGNTFVRITAVDGQQLVDELPPVEEYLKVQGSAQFE